MANVVKGADVPDVILKSIATRFLVIPNLEILEALPLLNPRFESICAPLIAKVRAKAPAPQQACKQGTTKIEADGSTLYYDAGMLLHRDEDLPAIILADGTQKWYQHGLLHREGIAGAPAMPAVMCANGAQEWYYRGMAHRDCIGGQPAQPADIEADGTKTWYRYGLMHREGDLPAFVGADGTQQWYINGQRHRDGDKPAIIYSDGAREWWQHDMRFREDDKPTVISADGTRSWYFGKTLIRSDTGTTDSVAVPCNPTK